MASEIVMPKQGNSVESCIILEWKVSVGDVVSVGDILCEAETDKSTIEVESTAEGTILQLLYEVGDEVPVMQSIAIVGEPGEKFAVAPSESQKEAEVVTPEPVIQQIPIKEEQKSTTSTSFASSPRARNTAEKHGVVIEQVVPTGPKNMVIERDVLAVANSREPLTPAAKESVLQQGIPVSSSGTGIGGRIRLEDLNTSVSSPVGVSVDTTSFPGTVEKIAVKGVRKVTAKRMRESLSTSAQLTLHASADARSLQQLRARLKASPEAMNLRSVTINDLILFAVAKTLVAFPYMNSHFLGDEIVVFSSVHLGCAVDTPKGLLVPVIKYADSYGLKGLSDEFKRLAKASVEGKASSEDLSGGTFTVTNLGALGIEYFTPVLNTPEVGILGVGNMSLKPVEGKDGTISYIPHIGLSLTIDHQAVDGAPGARFLKALCENIESIDLLLAY